MSALTAYLLSDILGIVLSILLLVIIYYGYHGICWYRRILVIGREVDKLPGDKEHWLYGTLAEHPGPNAAGMQYIIDLGRRNGGKVCRQWFGPFRPSVIFHHPDTVKLILRTAEPKALKGNGPYSFIRQWLGDGLLIADGAKWQRNRKLLTPAFHFDILKPYMEVNNEAVEILLGKWDNIIKAKPDESIEISGPISLCTLDIIMRCALSYNGDVQTDTSENLYVNSIFSLSQWITDRIFNIIMYVDWIYYKTSTGKKFAKACDLVHKVAEEIIEKRKAELKGKISEIQGRRLDFLDIILLARDETGRGLTDLEIRHEVDTFLFEGHDTTSSAMTWILYNLARHPEIQERVFEEVNDLIGHRDSPYVTWDDVGNEFQYMTMCIKESLRLHPAVPFINRDLTSPMEVEGVTLLPGTVIDIPIWMVHHNYLVWGEDHMDYKPERFNQENLKKMEPHSFIPFSAGPRNCIGQVFAMHELKVLTARIIHRYQLEVDETHCIEYAPAMVLRTTGGIKLRMKSRV